MSPDFPVIGVFLVTGTLFFFGSSLIAGRVFSKPHLPFYFALTAMFMVFKSLMLLNTQAVRGLKLIRVFAVMQLLPQGLNPLLILTFPFGKITIRLKIHRMD